MAFLGLGAESAQADLLPCPDEAGCPPLPNPCDTTPKINCTVPCLSHGDTQLLPPSVCGAEIPNSPCLGAVNTLVCDNPCLESGAAGDACQPPGDACVSAVDTLVCENLCVGGGASEPGAPDCAPISCEPLESCNPCDEDSSLPGPLDVLCLEDAPEACLPLPDTLCCLNSSGHEVAFRKMTDDYYSIYNVFIFEEVTDGVDSQKDLRIGWHNDLPESDKAVTFLLQSSGSIEHGPLGPFYPKYAVVSPLGGTTPCGYILFATGGSTAQPATVTIEGFFSGVTESHSEMVSETQTSETTVAFSSTKSRTWSLNVNFAVKPKPGLGGGAGYEHSTSSTHSYSTGESHTFAEGNSYTTTPTEWLYATGPFLV